MTAVTLFGLSLAPLYAAIAQVESDGGITSPNVYQIASDGVGYIEDVNRIMTNLHVGFIPYVAADRFDKAKSERMMYIYWMHWGSHYQRKTGKPVTYEVLARIHNGGPIGWKRSATDGYWAKVRAALEGRSV